jgi:hypothetical protein
MEMVAFKSCLSARTCWHRHITIKEDESKLWTIHNTTVRCESCGERMKAELEGKQHSVKVVSRAGLA